ncbi:MAG: hypothetical protein EBX91_05220 [Actinobacteria bacterium]|nr:hypothetical protein [Actinomycetota bacterium]
MSQILDGFAHNDQIKNFLLLLKAKGEKPGEVRALVDVMYERGVAIDIADRAVDIVGTGGDGAATINISTTAAIITTALFTHLSISNLRSDWVFGKNLCNAFGKGKWVYGMRNYSLCS